MLRELRIRNFAIIDEVVLQFGTGLYVLTGETGAGKSILVDAIELLLGGRGDSNVIRAGEETASVEGEFSLEEGILAQIKAVLEPEGLWEEGDSLTLAREMRREGRNIVRINGRNADRRRAPRSVMRPFARTIGIPARAAESHRFGQISSSTRRMHRGRRRRKTRSTRK